MEKADNDNSYQEKEEYQICIVERQYQGQVTNLNLKLMNQNYWTIPYFHINGMPFNPSKGILLLTSEYSVLLRGRHLWELHKRLLELDIAQIWEGGERFQSEIPENEPYIDAITFGSPMDSEQIAKFLGVKFKENVSF